MRLQLTRSSSSSLPSPSFFLSLSPSLRHARLHQVPRWSDGDFGRSGVVRVPGGGRAQTSHHLEEEGEESQLSTLWGRTSGAGLQSSQKHPVPPRRCSLALRLMRIKAEQDWLWGFILQCVNIITLVDELQVGAVFADYHYALKPMQQLEPEYQRLSTTVSTSLSVCRLHSGLVW